MGRRELHPAAPSAVLPASVTLPPEIAAAAANKNVDTPKKDEVEVPIPPAEPKSPETPAAPAAPAAPAEVVPTETTNSA